MALDWKKVASVRSGGKPYFYVSFTPSGKRTVVWDRIEKKWALQGDQEPPRGEAPVLGLFATAAAAMKFAEKEQKTMVADETRGSVKYMGKKVDYRLTRLEGHPRMRELHMRLGTGSLVRMGAVGSDIGNKDLTLFARDLFVSRVLGKLKTKSISSAARSTVDVYKVEWLTQRHGVEAVNVVAENGADAKAKVSKVTGIAKSQLVSRKIWAKGKAPTSSFTAMVIR